MDQATWKVSLDGLYPILREDGSLDLHSPQHVVILPGQEVTIDPHVEIHFPVGKEGVLRTPAGQRFETKPLVYDNVVVLNNPSDDQTVEIQRGDIIAQMTLIDSSRGPVRSIQSDKVKWMVVGDGLIPIVGDGGYLYLHCPRHVVILPGEDVTIDSLVKVIFPVGKVGVVQSLGTGQRFETERMKFDDGGIYICLSNPSDHETVEIQRGDVVARMKLRNVIDDDSSSDSSNSSWGDICV